MRVPIRKPGKYTHFKTDPSMTEEKFLELKNKLSRLKNFSRPRAAEEVKRLASDGDFSENAAYQMAKGRLRGINQRILEIEDLLKRAVLIKFSNNFNSVQIGCKVDVLVSGKEKNYQILGSSETNPSQGVISHNSPVGSALIGKKIGDFAVVRLNNKIIKLKVIKIY